MKKLFLISFSLLSYSVLGASCEELPIGESLRVQQSYLKSKTNIEQKYTLKRVDELNYEAYINFEFKNDKKLPEEDRITNDTFKDKVRGCFEKYNNRLLDEKGRNLSLRVYDENSDIQVPPKVSVKIKDFTFRSNSHAYSSDIDCETIIHESFHLLGLSDEYVEESNRLNPNLFLRIFKRFVTEGGKGTAFDCRAIGPLNSVMHNQFFLNSDIPVLFSAQLDVIIYPNCKEKNQEYYQCTRKSYRTSKDHGSLGGCGKVPDVCRSFNWLLSKDSPLRETDRAKTHFSDRKEMSDHFLLHQ